MKKRILTLFLSIAVVCTMTAGCASDTPSGGTPAEESVSADDTIYGQVKNIHDDTITLTLENAPGSDKSAPPPGNNTEGGPPAPPSMSGNGMDDRPAPSANSGDGDIRPVPSENSSDKDVPPVPSENAGAPPDTGQPAGEERDIVVTEETTYTVEDGAAAREGSLQDITERSMLQVTLRDDRTTASAITIRQGMPAPDSGDVPGADPGEMDLSGAETISGEKISSSDEAFSSSSDDENTVLITDQGSLHMAGATLTKSGDTSDDDSSNFYGLNAALAVTGSGTAELTNVQISSSGEGANAVFVTGEGSSAAIDNVKIHTQKDSARGLDATYGGTITASSVDITTEGAHCTALATDRGGGTVTVNGAALSTAGEGSPCIYSTGEISVQNAAGTASRSQTLVVEGKNSVALTGCDLQGAGPNGLMLYQSTSGDAQEGTAVLQATDSRLTTTSSGPMLYVTNTDAEVTLTDTALSFPGETLIQAAGNETDNWGVPGQNGGDLTLTGIHQVLRGSVSCDEISTVHLVLSEDSQLNGAIDTAHTGKEVSLALDDRSTWNVTADSYLSSLIDTQKSCSNIRSNGHTVYYDPAHADNKWLDGQTLALPGGGSLTPFV